MKRLFALSLLLLASVAHAQTEPDYSVWTNLLQRYYDPGHGMDYAHLKASDAATLQRIRQQLGHVDVTKLDRKQQLAYWINVYNINSVATIVENYPVKSIRDLSTDPIIRLNVFKKPRIPFGGAMLSLKDVEDSRIREGFHDPRIHFAINCDARSCPPMRTEAFTGAKLDAQLDDQARRFLGGSRLEKDGDKIVAHVTKIMDWFGDDFDKWGGGKAPFLHRFVSPDKQRLIDAAHGNVRFSYDDYDWALNDWKR